MPENEIEFLKKLLVVEELNPFCVIVHLNDQVSEVNYDVSGNLSDLAF